MQNGGRFDVLRFILLSNPVIASQSADWLAIRIPSLSPSVGVGVPDDPHAQPPCHAVGATLAVARRTPQTLSLRASAHTGVAIRTLLA